MKLLIVFFVHTLSSGLAIEAFRGSQKPLGWRDLSKEVSNKRVVFKFAILALIVWVSEGQLLQRVRSMPPGVPTLWEDRRSRDHFAKGLPISLVTDTQTMFIRHTATEL
jgi:hypothetical protein